MKPLKQFRSLLHLFIGMSDLVPFGLNNYGDFVILTVYHNAKIKKFQNKTLFEKITDKLNIINVIKEIYTFKTLTRFGDPSQAVSHSLYKAFSNNHLHI